MNTIHFTLQRKGGVGKTLSSTYLQQYLHSRSDKKSKVMVIDRNFTLMEKQRLSTYKKKLFEIMNKVIQKI